MCGINGFNFSNEELIRKMNAKVKHRGPDGDGVFVCGDASLGHTRLSIIDLSEKASQPMFSRDESLVLVFNGEIYNFQEIRDELRKKGHQFRSNSDSEVILNSYIEYGVDCLQKFNGIFAFAIFDKKDNSFFIARDRIGIKPLYYYWDPSTSSGRAKLVFSSEIKAILEHNIERKINKGALNIYFRTLYVPAPLTMFEGINKLEPASYLIYKNNKLEQKKYWQPSDFTDIANRSEAMAKIKELMKDSVRLQLISDRPVGIFLSGGIDSTVITGLVSELTNDKIKTFSANYDIKVNKFNIDADLAVRTSKYYQTEHQEVLVTGKDARDNFQKVIWNMDEPVANATQIATYLLSKETSREVAVVLGGDGGDELFGGYERYKLSGLISQYQKMPEILKKIVGEPAINFLKTKNKSIEKLRLIGKADRYLSFMSQEEKNISLFLKNEYNDKSIVGRFYEEKYFSEDMKDYEKQFMWADIRSWLPNESLIRSDKMSMAFGLEQRVPILDHRLVELSLKIPTKWKIKGKNSKAIFKEAMKEYIPEYIMNQPKRGWTSPASGWLRAEMKDLAYETLSPKYNPGMEEFFDFDNIKLMFDNHIEKKEYNMNLLWALITFQMWYRHFIKEKST
ncbi:MAG: asparagine synthase (glutamine-hydrolyzing) [Candidatus Magasanikbacteria bacterium RIFOXYA1_FULL_40_8]|uniref:asparagine synthase (glutamine-hydrolyzing) n=1 Tax=Candidatus Magasanikbacteria bacterium RIFOXYA1_FULL_40_8 TaxID=1798694 RepID=A0A1F6NUW0_9BACT|nr:MAG: asparagine synthase (glutamine-hydrolyzing) [Candidatus Magasanikbacteria bacterium RIFOXYA1_FULL_40_8]